MPTPRRISLDKQRAALIVAIVALLLLIVATAIQRVLDFSDWLFAADAPAQVCLPVTAYQADNGAPDFVQIYWRANDGGWRHRETLNAEQLEKQP